MTLSLDAVHYRYAGAARPALDGIDLVVRPGRVTGVVGANEAGKSTLCLVAAGLAPAVVGGHLAGRVTVGGRDSATARPHELAQRCGILLQDPGTQLSGTAATAWEEIALGPRNLALPLAEVVERVEASMAMLGIAHLAARDPGRLSGGQAQLVALAAILALRPACLVLDEPTSGLDPGGAQLVGDALLRLAREGGAAILVAEHRTDLLARLADEVLVLNGGRVAFTGPAAEILADPRLAELGVEPAAAVRDLLGRDAAVSGDLPSFLRPPSGTGPRLALGTNPPPGPGAPAITLDEVSFTYPGGVRALDRVSLAIGVGESVAIVGQNGSGKSTLLRHLDGLLRPERGRVLVGGAEIRARRVAEIARDVGLAFQDPDRQIFARTARDEVAFGPRNVGLRGADLDRAVTEALAAVGLERSADANPYDLGFSRRKLLSIASILAMRTPIVVLDEPTTAQDLRGIGRIQGIVRSLAANGRTVIVVSHELRFVAETFDRVVLLRDGRVLLDGSPAEILAEAGWPIRASKLGDPPAVAPG